MIADVRCLGRPPHSTAIYCHFLIFLLFMFCNNTSAQLPKDSELQQKILGAWQGTNSSFTGIITIYPKGVFNTRVTYNADVGKPQGDEMEGKWQIRDGYVIYTITKTTRPADQPVGDIERYKIIRLSETDLIYKDEQRGQVISLHKKQ